MDSIYVQAFFNEIRDAIEATEGMDVAAKKLPHYDGWGVARQKRNSVDSDTWFEMGKVAGMFPSDLSGIDVLTIAGTFSNKENVQVDQINELFVTLKEFYHTALFINRDEKYLCNDKGVRVEWVFAMPEIK